MKKIIVITGASSGIGRELVRQLSEIESADEIWAIARRADRLEELSAESKIAVRPICADLSCLDGIEVYRRALEEEKPEVQLTSMMDCIFLMLIFFLVSSQLKKIEKEIPLELPVSNVARDVKATPDLITVSVDSKGDL